MAEQLTTPTPENSANEPENKTAQGGNNPNRSRGEGSRTRHNKDRAASDPRNKNQNSGNTETRDVHEIWAEDYIRENVNLFENDSEEAESLIEARSMLADAATAAREGGLLSNRKKERTLEEAKEQYATARDAFMTQQLEAITSASADQRRAFVALLDSKERGALMGEEAYAYLETTEHASAFDRVVARYNDLPRSRKVVIGIGAAAATAAVAGLAAGGAAAGVALSGRIGRGYFSEEAKRRKGERTLEERQQAATLRQGNFEDYKAVRSELEDARASRPFERVDSALLERAIDADEKLNDQTDEHIMTERSAESRAKRVAVGKAALIGALGYGIGKLASEAGTFFSDSESGNGIDESEDAPRGSDIDAETQEKLDDLTNQIQEEAETSQDLSDQYEQELQRQQDLLQQLEDAESQGATTDEAVSEISERSQYLYGELAGEEVSISIPEGGNIWNQLEATVEDQMPSLPSDEKQRIVGNMLKVMEEQNPGRDLNLVYPGEEFRIEIPS